MKDLNFDEVYYLLKGADLEIKEKENHIIESKEHLNTAIERNDTEWQKVIIENIEYDTQAICALKSAIEKLKAI